MQSTAQSTQLATRLPVSIQTLLAAFATIPDPRHCRGIRFSLPALLALAVVVIISNHLSVLAIAERGARQSHDRLRALGFLAGVAPHQSSLQRLLRKLDPDQLSRALSTHFAQATSTPKRSRGSEGVAVDSKSQRGRLLLAASGCPAHVLSAFLHRLGRLLRLAWTSPVFRLERAWQEKGEEIAA